MTCWEYDSFTIPEGKSTHAVLNERGKMGWILCAVHTYRGVFGGTYFYCRRELPEGALASDERPRFIEVVDFLNHKINCNIHHGLPEHQCTCGLVSLLDKYKADGQI